MSERAAGVQRVLGEMAKADGVALARLKRERLPAWLCQQLHSGVPTPVGELAQLCGVTTAMIDEAIVELARRNVLIRRNFNGLWIDRRSWDAAQAIARERRPWAISV